MKITPEKANYFFIVVVVLFVILALVSIYITGGLVVNPDYTYNTEIVVIDKFSDTIPCGHSSATQYYIMDSDNIVYKLGDSGCYTKGNLNVITIYKGIVLNDTYTIDYIKSDMRIFRISEV